MSVACPHCRKRLHGLKISRNKTGKSKVMETRLIRAKTTFKGKLLYTVTVQRIRQCLTCRFRWKTHEVKSQ